MAHRKPRTSRCGERTDRGVGGWLTARNAPFEDSVAVGDHVRRVRRDDESMAAVTDRHADAVEDGELAALVVEVDPQRRTVAAELERDAVPRFRQARRELDVIAVLDHAGESMDDAGPDTTRIGDVHALGGVAVGVAQVEVERPVEVFEGQRVVADLGLAAGSNRWDVLRSRSIRASAAVIGIMEVDCQWCQTTSKSD